MWTPALRGRFEEALLALGCLGSVSLLLPGRLSLSVHVWDYLGIAIGEGCSIPKIRTHLQGLLQWARAHQTSQSFYVQVGKFRVKERLLNDIGISRDTGASRHIGRDQLWKLLRRFVVLSFDFDSTGSRTIDTSFLDGPNAMICSSI